MFPNFRLLIGALFITVLVLSCEFGVFAALRVNREPLSRLTSESAPLQLVAGKNAPAAVAISWRAPLNVPAPAAGAPTAVDATGATAPQPAERAIETPASPNDGTVSTANDQTNPAARQAALTPSPALPAAVAPAADAARPIPQPPMPPPAKTPAPTKEAAANPEANGAQVQKVVPPAAVATTGNGAPEQATAAPDALAGVPAQQAPGGDIVKPAEPQEPQVGLATQPHDTAAPMSEPPAGGTPAIAAIAPAAPAPAAAPPPSPQPVEITGSVPNAAMPMAAAPTAAAPHAKPVRKIVHKPAAKKPHKVAHEPAQPHHAVKKRIVRRSRAPAAASLTQTVSSFDNPVFQSAPQFQRPTRRRAGARTTATNNGFSNTFGGQFRTQ